MINKAMNQIATTFAEQHDTVTLINECQNPKHETRLSNAECLGGVRIAGARKGGDVVIYHYMLTNKKTGTQKAILTAYRGNCKTPYINYYYPKTEQRENAFYRACEAALKSAATQRAAQVTANQPHNVQVGDVFESHWGYDQTNVDYYQVVALHGKTMCSLRPIKGGGMDIYGSEAPGQRGGCVPYQADQFTGPAFRRQISMTSGQPGMSIESYEYASPVKAPGSESKPDTKSDPTPSNVVHIDFKAKASNSDEGPFADMSLAETIEIGRTLFSAEEMQVIGGIVSEINAVAGPKTSILTARQLFGETTQTPPSHWAMTTDQILAQLG